MGKVSTGHKKNLSHFYISKKFWKPCQTFGRLVLAVWSRADWLVFFKVSRTFLKYENGSKNFYELLRSILTYTELPYIFEKKVITLALRGFTELFNSSQSLQKAEKRLRYSFFQSLLSCRILCATYDIYLQTRPKSVFSFVLGTKNVSWNKAQKHIYWKTCPSPLHFQQWTKHNFQKVFSFWLYILGW